MSTEQATLLPKQKTYRIAKYKLSYVKEGSVSFPTSVISRRDDVEKVAREYLKDCPYEQVLIIALNNSNRIIGLMVTEGTIDQCAIYPKNVFTFLLSSGAASFVMAHNHPGGNMSPSSVDWNITDQLKNIGKLLNQQLLDHIIVADEDIISMREIPRWNK